ncbi:MAG: hypothetical protein M1823_002748 [Watsoniomyces obsoletus]|nr:MAG: hypothetical protein M1823_002748 [Watsoniomyces obsoletus]
MLIPPLTQASSLSGTSYVCTRCLLSFRRRPPRLQTRGISSSRSSSTTVISAQQNLLLRKYFLANDFVHSLTPESTHFDSTQRNKNGAVRLWKLDRIRRSTYRSYFQSNPATQSKLGDAFNGPLTPSSASQIHQRRRKSAATPSPDADRDRDLPLDASSRLSTLSMALPSRSLRRLFSLYLSLSKPRLSFLIVLTTTTAYSLFPVPALLLPSTTVSPSLSTLTLLFLTTGTALASASANSLNMLFEPEHDAKMSRTRNRPLVRKLVTPRATAMFAGLTGAAGLCLLLFGVNPTVAALGGLNIFLYAGVYTPMKRLSVVNTWVGAIVGGIPPLMGWAAAAGQCATGGGGWQELLLGPESVGGWLLAGLLFAWQFPHFNALSWTIREEYRNAGHQMLAWVNPKRNARVALRYAVMCFPICVALWAAGVTDQGFLVSSSVVNAWLVREAWRFWRREGGKGSARALFWASVWHLPVVMVLAMMHKKGLWERIWRGISGVGEEEVIEEEEDDDDIVRVGGIETLTQAS